MLILIVIFLADPILEDAKVSLYEVLPEDEIEAEIATAPATIEAGVVEETGAGAETGTGTGTGTGREKVRGTRIAIDTGREIEIETVTGNDQGNEIGIGIGIGTRTRIGIGIGIGKETGTGAEVHISKRNRAEENVVGRGAGTREMPLEDTKAVVAIEIVSVSVIGREGGHLKFMAELAAEAESEV